MSLHLEQLTLNDFEEATDLLNYVFSQAHGPHDFEALLPKLYRPTEERMGCNYGIRHRGMLVAIAGVFPLTWQVGEATLRVAGIGGVATHPRHRGKELMRAVVSHCVAAARAAGYQLSWLDGLRRRYRHFGYERCGTEISFRLTARDFAGAGIDAAGLRFRRLQEGDALLAEVQRLHARQQVHWRRPATELLSICASWNSAPYAALDGGEFAGYLIAGRDPTRVSELVAVDAAATARVAAGLVCDARREPDYRGSLPLADRRGVQPRCAGRSDGATLLRQLAGVRLAGVAGGAARRARPDRGAARRGGGARDRRHGTAAVAGGRHRRRLHRDQRPAASLAGSSHRHARAVRSTSRAPLLLRLAPSRP